VSSRIWMLAAAGALVVGVGTSQAAPPAPAYVVIDACASKRPPVRFAHERHAVTDKIPCATCHHKGKPSMSCASAGCHAGSMSGSRTGCAEKSIKKNPYHMICRECHRSNAAAMEAKAPRSCKTCHAGTAFGSRGKRGRTVAGRQPYRWR